MSENTTDGRRDSADRQTSIEVSISTDGETMLPLQSVVWRRGFLTGKPVVEYLGVTSEESLAIDINQGELLVTVGEDGGLSYSTYAGTGSREYAQFTLGSADISALGAGPSDTIQVDADGDAVRIAVAEVEDPNE